MTLDPLDYWKLRASASDVDRDQAALAVVHSRLAQSQTRKQQLWQEISAKYGLDAAAAYSLRDDDCSLTLQTSQEGSST